jgi:hypothetical protein
VNAIIVTRPLTQSTQPFVTHIERHRGASGLLRHLRWFFEGPDKQRPGIVCDVQRQDLSVRSSWRHLQDREPGTPEYEAEDRQFKRADEALRAFLVAAPTTLGGAIAALEYAASPEGGISKDYTNLESGAQLAGDIADRFPLMIATALRQMQGAS